jgi:hypothetical protein
MSSFKVATICGSMRYFDLMLTTAEEYTANGWIILMPFKVVGPEEQATPLKEMLDIMHYAKIDMSDAIIVVGEYQGRSTNNEIAHAANHGKGIIYVS